MDLQFWQDKRVFMTGHTGFKGSWLALWLQSLGANVCGYALKPQTDPNLFELAQVAKNMTHHLGDVRDFENLRQKLFEFKPEIVIHMAAQPLVRYSYANPIETYSVNVMGAVHLLEAAHQCEGVKVVLNVTSDKCYENKEWAWGYRENEPMGGFDPYSNSKGCAELVTSAYRRSFYQGKNIALASARAGNVIGGGDWSSDRLIPDVIRCIANAQAVLIRNPDAIRPWQHVLEPLSGYLLLIEKAWHNPSQFAEGWNFGPTAEGIKPVKWLVEYLLKRWDAKSVRLMKIDEGQHPHEAHFLKLDISKAADHLHWSPRLNLETGLNLTVDWYRAWKNSNDMRDVTLQQIKDYEQLIK